MALTAEEAIIWYGKMCKMSGRCSNCEIGKKKEGALCLEYCIENVQEALDAIERYKIEHSKTLAEDFFEKFPNAPKNKFEIPLGCPYHCGYDSSPRRCDATPGKCRECWNRLLEEV